MRRREEPTGGHGRRSVVTRSSLLAALAAVLFAAAACDDDAPDLAGAEPVELDGHEYLGESVDGYEVVVDTEIRISFDEGSVGVSAGCNRMFGAYTVDGDVLVVDELASTEMGCPEPLMEQDAWITAFLQAGPRVALDGTTLMLTGDDATITLVDREVADPDRPLEGTAWVVDGLVSGDAVSSLPEGVVATMTITDGRANVEAGCNTGSSEVQLGDGTITFGPLALTRMMCEPAAMEVEIAVVATLDGEVTYEIEGDVLRLTNDTSGTGLTLRARP